MSKEYRYRRILKAMGLVAVVVISVFLLLLLSMYLFGFRKEIYYVSRFLGELIIGQSFLGIILLLIMDYILRAGISVSIEDNAIIYRKRRKEKKILLNAVSNLKFSFWGAETDSGFKIVSENNTIPISMVLQDISSFIQELKNAIDQKGLSISYDQKKLFSFFKRAVLSDQSWVRLSSISWKLAVIGILSGVIGITCAILSRFSSLWFGIGTIWWILFSMFFTLFSYYYAEGIFRRRLVKQINEQSFTYPPRDIAYEKTIYRKVLIFGALIYIVISIIAVFILRSISI